MNSQGSPWARAALNLLLVCLCLVVLVRFLRELHPTTVVRAREGVWVVGSVSPIPEPPIAIEARLVVVLIGSKCEYCRQEMPLYRRLEEVMSRSRRDGDRVEFVGFEKDEVLKAFLADNGVLARHVRSVPKVTEVRATPTIVLLDSNMRVRASWQGVLSGEQEQHLFQLLQ